MNELQKSVDLKCILGTTVHSAQRQAEFHKLLQRGLNTWEDAPKWLLDLSDQLETGGLITSEATSQAPDWRELTRRLFVELRNCNQVMLAAKEDGKPVFIQEASVRDVLRDAKASLEVKPSSQAHADTKQPEHKAEPREVTDALQACLNACNRVIAQDKGVLGGIDFHALKLGVLRGLAHAQNEAVPAILFDGYAVLQALDARAQTRTSPENVSDVLDAVVREMRSGKSEPVRALTSTLKGWSISASDDADGCTWLKIQHPSGAQASISVRTKTGNGDRTIAAQILADLHTDFKAANGKVGAA